MQQAAINAGQTFLSHLVPQTILNLQVGPGTKIESNQFRCPFAQALGDVIASDDQILVLIILTTNDDMTVRMASVVVIDGDPIEAGREILLHLRHQATGQRFQVFVFGAIFRGDNETELVAVPFGAVEEGLAIGTILFGTV